MCALVPGCTAPVSNCLGHPACRHLPAHLPAHCLLTCLRHSSCQLGTYDPIASKDGVKEVRVKVDRMKYWLSVGAQPSETVARLLAHVGMLPPPPIRSVRL